jgi:hypothetical protein
MIVSVVFVHKKICFKKRKVGIIFMTNLKFKKKPKKTFLVGFFGWVFYCQPCLESLQLQLIQPAPAPTLQVKRGVLHHPGVFIIYTQPKSIYHRGEKEKKPMCCGSALISFANLDPDLEFVLNAGPDPDLDSMEPNQ